MEGGGAFSPNLTVYYTQYKIGAGGGGGVLYKLHGILSDREKNGGGGRRLLRTLEFILIILNDSYGYIVYCK